MYVYATNTSKMAVKWYVVQKLVKFFKEIFCKWLENWNKILSEKHFFFFLQDELFPENRMTTIRHKQLSKTSGKHKGAERIEPPPIFDLTQKWIVILNQQINIKISNNFGQFLLLFKFYMREFCILIRFYSTYCPQLCSTTKQSQQHVLFPCLINVANTKDEFLLCYSNSI